MTQSPCGLINKRKNIGLYYERLSHDLQEAILFEGNFESYY